MSFCHALETKRRALLAKGNLDALSRLPVVEAFEKSSTSGGVWKKTEDDQERFREFQQQEDEGTTPMYEGLWVNGPKEMAEYFDYSYDEHFGCALPPYVPRQAILEYMVARVAKNNVGDADTKEEAKKKKDEFDFFKKYVTFRTEVTSVRFDGSETRPLMLLDNEDDSQSIQESDGFFVATTRNLDTGEERVRTYDKVIWAAGANAIPKIPQSIANVFGTGSNFTGKTIHSSEVATLEDDIKGKRVLIVGGASSAEDLALTSIKLGVEKIYISFRNSENSVGDVEMWPYNKVELLENMVPGRAQGDCIEFAYVDPITLQPLKEEIAEEEDDRDSSDSSDSSDEEEDSEDDGDGDEEVVKVCGIDTVIICTGYNPDFSMLHPSVIGEEAKHVDIFNGTHTSMPRNWRMQSNGLSSHLGDVEPAERLEYWGREGSRPYLYRYGVAPHNPSMMYMVPNAVSLDQLIWADALAWQLLAFITGTSPLPNTEGRIKWIHEQLEHEMQISLLRSKMDSNYRQARLLWLYGKEWCSLNEEEEREMSIYHFRALADVMRVGGYPVDLGSFDGLNENGRRYVAYDMNDRDECEPEANERGQTKEAYKKTFRDITDEARSHIVSVFTGTVAAPFPKMWMDIDDFGEVRDLCVPLQTPFSQKSI